MAQFELSSRAGRSRTWMIQLDCFVSAAKPRFLAMTNGTATGAAGFAEIDDVTEGGVAGRGGARLIEADG
jgi:hypothetical protein